MVFEVTSLKIAKGLGFVVVPQYSWEYNQVVISPENDEPLPSLIHGEGWVKVSGYYVAEISKENYDRYLYLNALVIQVWRNRVTIFDLAGLAYIEIKKSYDEALCFLEYYLERT
ncbi:hypothetical protein IJU97_01350 [bacterium]|nr:hypothetical protein [bacterium]